MPLNINRVVGGGGGLKARSAEGKAIYVFIYLTFTTQVFVPSLNRVCATDDVVVKAVNCETYAKIVRNIKPEDVTPRKNVTVFIFPLLKKMFLSSWYNFSYWGLR